MAASLRIFRIAGGIACKCPKFRGFRSIKFKPTILTTSNQVRGISKSRPLHTEEPVTAAEIKKGMEALTDKFAEAREMLDDTRESMGTVYFSEDMAEAQTAVNETLEEYKKFLDSLSDKQKQEVISTIGLRMEELKAQKAAIEETLKD